MQGGLNVKFNNNYHVELIDSTTGEVRQSGDFHNTIVKRLYLLLLGTSTYSESEVTAWARYGALGRIIRVGSGTTQPSFDDTALAGPLWTSGEATETTYEWLDEYTIRKTASFTFPATASYVGTISEIGLGYAYYEYSSSGHTSSEICTRALLTDSEGQVITFNKTDLDILVIKVTVEATIASSSENFKIVKKNDFLRFLLGEIKGNNNYFHHQHGSLNLIRFNNGKENIHSVFDRGISPGSNPVAKLTASEAYIRYPVGRMLADTVTSQTYYNAVSIPDIGYWELPNEEIFPAYSIRGIEVGTGDGVTTQFENPLNYFKANSEKVYKNGVQLTRGTDYTISNMGNKDCLPEITQLIPISRVYSDVSLTSTSLQVYPLIIPVPHGSSQYSGFKSAYEYDVTQMSPAFSASYPLYIEYEEAVTMNCFKCTGGLKTLSGASGYNNISTGAMFYLDYSLDGQVYTEVASAATTATNGVFNMDFAGVTAKYWRVRTNLTSYVAMPRDDSHEYFMTLNRKDPYIVFTTAPAVGDTITMDVDMDIIMKNSNFVIDMSCRLDFNL